MEFIEKISYIGKINFVDVRKS